MSRDEPTKKTVQDAIEETPGPSISQLAGVRPEAAAAAHFLRRGPGNSAAIDIVWDAGGEWVILADGSDRPIDRFTTREEAIRAGRRVAADAAPSELAIRDKDGRVQETLTYE